MIRSPKIEFASSPINERNSESFPKFWRCLRSIFINILMELSYFDLLTVKIPCYTELFGLWYEVWTLDSDGRGALVLFSIGSFGSGVYISTHIFLRISQPNVRLYIMCNFLSIAGLFRCNISTAFTSMTWLNICINLFSTTSGHFHNELMMKAHADTGSTATQGSDLNRYLRYRISTERASSLFGRNFEDEFWWQLQVVGNSCGFFGH